MTDTSEAIATITRNDLAGALTFASLGVPRRPVLPILAAVLVTVNAAGLELSAFDYETAAIARAACETAGEAVVLANGTELAAAVKTLPKGRKVTAELTIADGRLLIQCEGTEASISSLPLEEYPKLPELPELSGVIDGASFARTVARVVAAAGTDDTLPVLLCVNMASDGGELEFAATDRYRLAVDRLHWTGPDGVASLVPARTLAAFAGKIDKRGKVALHLAEGFAGFTDGARTLIASTNPGTFPKYRSLIPDSVSDTLVTVDAAKLETAVTRAGKMTERNMPIGFDVSDAGITITVNRDGKTASSQTVPATVDGRSFEARFNPAYLSSLLKGFTGDVRLGFRLTTDETADADGNKSEIVTTSKPVKLTADGDTFTAVCMPIRRAQ